VDATANISLSLVNHVVNESSLQAIVISDRVIGVHGAPKFHVPKNRVLQSLASDIRHNLSAYLAKIAVKNSVDNRLACVPASIAFCGGKLHTARTVHILNLATNKGFIHFHFIAFAADLRHRPVAVIFFHHLANALQHKPCRRLRYSQSAAKLMRTDSVLRIRQQPKRGHPLIKSDRRIFHDRLDFDRELLFAGVAKPQLARLDKRVLRRLAAWTHNVAVRPAHFLGVLKAAVRVGKVNNGFLQRLGFGKCVRVHVENDTTRTHVCQLVYCPATSMILKNLQNGGEGGAH
jgi:hypothetical protein